MGLCAYFKIKKIIRLSEVKLEVFPGTAKELCLKDESSLPSPLSKRCLHSVCLYMSFIVFKGHSTGQKSPLEVKGPVQTVFLLLYWSPSSVGVVFELQLLRDSWKWTWPCLKRIKRRPCLCWARGQFCCYCGNDLACHRVSVTALKFNEMSKSQWPSPGNWLLLTC